MTNIDLTFIRALNDSAGFNRWAGFEVTEAAAGRAEIVMPFRADLGQYAGFLHAGVIAALIDTACGFAAATLAGRVLAAQCGVEFYAPAVGERFVVRAQVTKAGRRQVFTRAELFAIKDGVEKLVAGGSTVLMVADA